MRSQSIFDLLQKFESQNITFIDSKNSWPIVWKRAKGSFVWDIQGKKYLDLTSAFGVAATGHTNSHVVKAGQRQMARLLHAMSDVHPHALKAKLAQALSRLTFERWSKKRISGKVIFCNSGSEAVEAALKTAKLVTDKPEVISFRGAYHGLGYGALNVTHREHFRNSFQTQLREFGHFVNFPTSPSELDATETEIRLLLSQRPIAGILVEPVQGRGGINIPPSDFLPRLRQLCNESGALLILDEIYTGFGRTGRWFACEHSNTEPDIICLGKALTGGFPLSACVGRADLMDIGWPPATGDPIHTSTFLGHPVGCAMALAQIDEIKRLNLVKRSEVIGNYLRSALSNLNQLPSLTLSSRSIGLLGGLEMRLPDGSAATEIAFQITKKMLKRGFILLLDGEFANILSFTPPLTISERQLKSMFIELNEIISNQK